MALYGSLDEVNLPALSKEITDNAVDIFVYDTSKDSDGGKWRKRTKKTSWYNENLDTSDRGSRKEFPVVAVIVAESTKLTIYDGDNPDFPMWMVFDLLGAVGANSNMLPRGGSTSQSDITSVACLNAKLVVGLKDVDGTVGEGPIEINFISDFSRVYREEASGFTGAVYNLPISGRNSNGSYYGDDNTLGIIDQTINDVAMTVLPNAPIDDATGLPIPTIALGTDEGVSIIKDNGTVVDITSPSTNDAVDNIALDNEYVYFTSPDSGAATEDRMLFVYNIPSSDINNTFGYNDNDAYLFTNFTPSLVTPSTPSIGISKTSTYEDIADMIVYDKKIFSALPSGLAYLNEHTTTSSNGSVAHITSNYNTGWMHGDTKISTLTSAGTNEELINYNFHSNYTYGWEAKNNASVSYDSTNKRVTVTSTQNYSGLRVKTANLPELVPGIQYTATVSIHSITNRIRFGVVSGLTVDNITTPGEHTVTFTAGAAVTEIFIEKPDGANSTFVLNHFSIREAIAPSRTELITNGDFTINADGWDADDGTISYSAGRAQVNRTGGSGLVAFQAIPTVIGTKYVINGTVDSNGSGGRGDIRAYSNYPGTTILGNAGGTNNATVDVSATFVATTTTTYIYLVLDNHGICHFDNVSVRIANTTTGPKAGINLVYNGQFDTNITGWTPRVNTIVTQSSGRISITNDGQTNGRATSTAFDTTIGAKYIIQYDAISTNSASYGYRVEIRESGGYGSEQGFTSSTDGVRETFEFTATHTQHTIVLYSIGASGVTTVYDNVSVTPSELVVNGTFDSNINSWTASGVQFSHTTNNVGSNTGGKLMYYATGGNTTRTIYQDVVTIPGVKYILSFDSCSDTANANTIDIDDIAVYTLADNNNSAFVRTSINFVASTTTTRIRLRSTVSNRAYLDNVSVRLAEEDRSVNDNGLKQYGKLTKSPVATNAELMGYTGWSSSNYLKQEINYDLAPGTSPYSVTCWVKTGTSTNDQYIFDRNGGGPGSRNLLLIMHSNASGNSANKLQFWHRDATGNVTEIQITDLKIADNHWHQVVALCNGTAYKVYVDGVESSVTHPNSNVRDVVSDNDPPLYIGIRHTLVAPMLGHMALFRYSRSAPTPEQIKKMYNDERRLFQENSDCTLYNVADNVKALAYDNKSKLLHVGTESGRSDFRGLRRINNTTTGITTAISASNKLIAEQ